MKPILIHIHIFYSDIWAEIKSYILNIKNYAFKLHITLVQDNKELKEEILASFPDSKIYVVPNRGFDVAPFIFVINQIELSDYSYIIKLHTKRDVKDRDLKINGFDVTGDKWRRYLLRFLETPELFTKQINLFDKKSSVGMISSYEIIAGRIFKDTYDREATALTLEFINKQLWPLVKFNYIAGTMFIVRSHLLQKIKDLNLTFDDFPEPDAKKSAQLAHVMERLLGYTVYSQGYTITDGTITLNKKIFHHIQRKSLHITRYLSKLFYQKKHTTSNHLIIKIIKIPIVYKNTKKL